MPPPIDPQTKVAVMIEFFDNPNQTMQSIGDKFKIAKTAVKNYTSEAIKMPEKERQILFQKHRIMQHE